MNHLASPSFFRTGSIGVAAVLAFASPAIGRAEPRAAGSPASTESPKTAASADENTRLQALFRKGITAFEAGNDQESLKALGEAWAIRHTYDIAAALAQTELALGRYRDAAEHLDYGLNHFVPGESEKTLELMRKAFTEVKQHVAALRLEVNEQGATVELDGHALGLSPLPSVIFVEPGAHALSARRGDRLANQQLEVQAGREYRVRLELAESNPTLVSTPGDMAPNAMGSRQPPPSSNDRSLVPVAIGATVAALGVAGLATFSAMASSDADTMQQLREQNGAYGCSDGTASASDCAAQHDAAISHDRHRTLALASTLVGVVGLASIPVYWFWPRAPAPAGEKAAPRPRVRGTVGVGSVTILGEF